MIISSNKLLFSSSINMAKTKNSANSIFGGTAKRAAKKAAGKQKVDAAASGSGSQLDTMNSQRLLMGKSVVGTFDPILLAESESSISEGEREEDVSLEDQESGPRYGEREVSDYCIHSLQTLS
jgi:hypothetical protein